MSIFNRAEIIDNNFLKNIENYNLPISKSDIPLSSLGVSLSTIVSIFESQVISRHTDLKARILKDKGKCFYTIGSSGHEGNAVFGKFFPFTDTAFLHYRSAPFFLERSKQINGSTPLYDLALSYMASSEDPISGGRHKVIGSKNLNIPPQTSTIASHLPKAVGTAFSIDRAKDLDLRSSILNQDSIVICSFGDASANHASALSAINTASWICNSGGHVPIVFICEDNGIGISVPTNPNWIKKSFGNRFGIEYVAVDGLNMFDLIHKTKFVEQKCRLNRKPIFLHMKTIRLIGHAGSDIELGYKTLEQITAIEKDDPLLHSARIILENGILSSDEILRLYELAREQVSNVFEHATLKPKLKTRSDVMSSIVGSKTNKILSKAPTLKIRKTSFKKEFERINISQHMAKLINYTLIDLMLEYENIVVFGEDVAEKGGVYNVTSELFNIFSARRVFNSPLDETSIIGFAMGFSNNGFIPIPEIQFLAYFHNAEDQLRGEAATLSFFSKGQFLNPMVLRIPGLAYQKGFGGHFHNDNSLTIFRDIPGLILAVPSNGLDASLMLRQSVLQANENGRIVVFIEPIALYMTRDLHVKKDGEWLFRYPSPEKEIKLGEFKVYGDSKHLTIISYGNGLFYSLQAKKDIEQKIDKEIKVIDLRWLSDINYEMLKKETAQCSNILIVDECRKSGCYGEGIFVNLSKNLNKNKRINLHASEDSFISLGDAATVTLISKDSIIKESLKMLNEKK